MSTTEKLPATAGEATAPHASGSARHAPQQTVTLDDVHHVALLANLELTADEAPRMQRDLNAILEHIAELNALDTTGVEPMTQVSSVVADAEHAEVTEAPQTTEGSLHLRQDLAEPSLDRPVVMAEAPETDGRFFKVPKVIER